MATRDDIVTDPYLGDYEVGFEDLLGSDLSSEEDDTCFQPLHQSQARLCPKHGPLMPKVVNTALQRGGTLAPKAKCGRAVRGDGQPMSSRPTTLRPKSGGTPTGPTTTEPMPKSMPAAKSRSRIPGSLRDWGIPQYSAQSRSNFCWEFRNDPSRLRRRVTNAILAHPGYTNYQFNRLLYNEFGARVAELNSLFDCRGIGQLTDRIFNYDQNCQDLREIVSEFDQRMERCRRQPQNRN